jgi:hypothetical protein
VLGLLDDLVVGEPDRRTGVTMGNRAKHAPGWPRGLTSRYKLRLVLEPIAERIAGVGVRGVYTGRHRDVEVS